MVNFFKKLGRARSVMVGLVVVTSVLAECNVSGASGLTSKRSQKAISLKSVDFANYMVGTPLLDSLQSGLQADAKKIGVNLGVYNNNADGATTLSNAQIMANGKPNVIMEYNPVADTGQRLAQIFSQANIPCIAVNISFSGCSWFNQSDSLLARELAKYLAPVLKKRGWSGKNTTIVLMVNPPDGNSVNVGMWEDYVDLTKLVPHFAKMKVSSFSGSTTSIGSTGVQIAGGTGEDSAFTAMSNALQTIPASRNVLVFTIDDVYTLGAYRAIVAAGRKSHALLTGFGPSSPSVHALRTNPDWIAEEGSFFGQWGEYLLALAAALKAGVKPPHLTVSPSAVLTHQNVNEYYSPGKSASPRMLPALSAQDKFLAATGVLQRFHNVLGLK